MAGVLAAFPVILGRLFYLQIVDAKELARRAERQQQRLVTVHSRRGTIYDREMQELAVSLRTYSLFARPAEVMRPGRVADALHRILGLPRREIWKKLRADKSFVWIKRQLEPAETKKVQRLEAAGLGFIPEDRRFYPRGVLAGQVLGFVGIDGHGLAGVEYQFDRYLAGKAKKELVERDALGRLLLDPENDTPEAAYDLVLTLNGVVQFFAEKELRAEVARTKARYGVALFMDPYTGAILAMADAPAFDPNHFRSQDQGWQDRAVADAYEPGSTFKVVTISGALEEGLVTPQSRLFCGDGEISVGGRVIRDHAKFGWLTVDQILSQSSNVGAIKIGEKLGQKRLYEYIRRFGFGSKSGVDLPGEASGLVRPVKEWSEVSLGAVPIGQEISVTPLQMVRAMAAIANGGVLVYPHVLREMRRPDGEMVTPRPVPGVRIISGRTSRRMVAMLKDVVRNGTGKHAAIAGYEVAGKTGTAQEIDPATGTYSRTRYVASFLGFVPADHPRLVGIVVLNDPQGGDYWGGSVAAPVFARIAAQALRYLRVPPSVPAAPRVPPAAAARVPVPVRLKRGA